jgi:hypothetical protein
VNLLRRSGSGTSTGPFSRAERLAGPHPRARERSVREGASPSP